MFWKHILLLTLFFFTKVLAMPLDTRFGSDNPPADGTPTSFSQDQVNSILQRPAELARAAFCNSTSLLGSTCGTPCDAIKDVQILQSGGGELFD
jgi:hypothetical protein